MTEEAISEEMLHAFIDGELDREQEAAVARRIAQDARLGARIAAFRADKERLAALYGPLIARPLPAEWLRLIASHGRRRSRVAGWRLAAMAASLLACMAGGWLAYRAIESPRPDTVIAEALGARDETRPAERIIAADSLGTAEARNRLLTAALAVPVNAPDLGRMGFSLAQLRLYAGTSGEKSAELAYRDTQGRLVTFYLRRSPGAPRFDIIERGKLKICVWQDDVLSSVLTGEMSAGEMLRLASLAYSGMNP